MAKQDFKDTIIDEILELLKDNLGSAGFKKFFYGDRLYIPQSQMPCVTVQKLSTDITDGPTGMDNKIFTVRIKLIFNKKLDFRSNPEAEASSQRQLEELAEGVDADDGETSQSSVCGILRTNYTISQTAHGQSIRVDYRVAPRPQDTITEEAHITAQIKQLTTVTSRV